MNKLLLILGGGIGGAILLPLILSCFGGSWEANWEFWPVPGAFMGLIVAVIIAVSSGNSKAETKPTPSPKLSAVEQVAELKKLLDADAITQQEFDEQKKKIFNS